MAMQDLAPATAVDPFTDEDRLQHLTKYVERTFGRELAELGTAEIKDGRAVLTFDWGGKPHTARWARQAGGGIVWYIDDRAEPVVLGPSDRIGRQLTAILGNAQV